MKKIIVPLLVLATVSVGAFAGAARKQVRADEDSDVSKLIASYAAAKQYTKKSQIFLKEAAIADFETYFHAGATRLERSTYYDETADALLMGDYDGSFTNINSGYRKAGENMEHFRATAPETVEGLYVGTSDYKVNNTSPNEYFVNLSTLANITKVGTGWINYEANGATIYQYAVGAIEMQDGEYKDQTLKDFQYFAAPMLLQTNYFSYKYIEVADATDFLSIRIYLTDSDSGKVTVSARGTDYMMCEARVYKGLSYNPGPEWYVIGDEKGNWGETSSVKLTYAMDSAHIVQYKAEFDLSIGEKIKLRNGATWVGYSKLEATSWLLEGDSDNMVAQADGDYELYYKPLIASNNLYIGNKTGTATKATINFYCDLTNKGDVTAWGGKVYIVGDFCSWTTTNANAISLTETSANSKKWYGSVVWDMDETYKYKIRLNNSAGTWGDENNWYPDDDQTITVSYPTTINISW